MKITNCRLCSGTLSKPKLKFPDTPLANEFVKTKESQELFPLQVCICNDCGHFQLNESIDRERLFKHYLFVAGTSPVNVEHFRQYAVEMTSKFKLKPGSKILDIASNDGILLQHFKDLGMIVLGIDPAENIAKMANENGIETIPEFFTEDYADKILEKYGQFNLITANNVFAHISDMTGFIKGVKKLLAPQGIFSFEVSYFGDVCDKNLFDTIYHEHTSYHTLNPLVYFFKCHGLNLFDVKQIDNHGGSIRVFVKVNQDGFLSNYLRKGKVFQLCHQETEIEEKVKTLFLNINNLGSQLRTKLKQLKQEGKSIAVFGFPAKATTLSYVFDIGPELIDFVIDDAPLKQGTFTPGKHIPVYSSEAIEERKPDVLLILAWNFSQSIIEKHKNYNGIWIIPLPEFKEYQNKK